jgi:hypothetical protein
MITVKGILTYKFYDAREIDTRKERTTTKKKAKNNFLRRRKILLSF